MRQNLFKRSAALTGSSDTPTTSPSPSSSSCSRSRSGCGPPPPSECLWAAPPWRTGFGAKSRRCGRYDSRPRANRELRRRRANASTPGDSGAGFNSRPPLALSGVRLRVLNALRSGRRSIAENVVLALRVEATNPVFTREGGLPAFRAVVSPVGLFPCGLWMDWFSSPQLPPRSGLGPPGGQRSRCRP